MEPLSRLIAVYVAVPTVTVGTTVEVSTLHITPIIIFMHLATPQMLKIRMQYCVTNCPRLPRISYTAVSLNAQRRLGLDCWP